MKLRGFRLLAASSLLMTVLAAHAATRPLYGGILHISVREAPITLDPTDTTQRDSFARRGLAALIFETLVSADENGRTRPGLATSWKSTDENQRWQFHLHTDVIFQDATPLTPAIATASLQRANPSWKINYDADAVLIECATPCPHLPEQLALAREAIVKSTDDGTQIGTGPFQIAEWKPGKKLFLKANEGYWAGRPFLDGIEVEFGVGFREQQMARELRKTDLIEISPEQSRAISTANREVSNSEPVELVALVFAQDTKSAEEKLLREALALCIERDSIRRVILQGSGEASASLLPNWMSGYAFALPAAADLIRAKGQRAQVRNIRPWTISYDSSDPLAGLLAQRVALYAQDAGLRLQPTNMGAADIRIMRIPLLSDPALALGVVATSAGLPSPQIAGDSAEDLFAAERDLLSTQKIIPLFHLPVIYGAAPALRNWAVRRDGRWNLVDAWLAREPSGSVIH